MCDEKHQNAPDPADQRDGGANENHHDAHDPADRRDGVGGGGVAASSAGPVQTFQAVVVDELAARPVPFQRPRHASCFQANLCMLSSARRTGGFGGTGGTSKILELSALSWRAVGAPSGAVGAHMDSLTLHLSECLGRTYCGGPPGGYLCRVLRLHICLRLLLHLFVSRFLTLLVFCYTAVLFPLCCGLQPQTRRFNFFGKNSATEPQGLANDLVGPFFKSFRAFNFAFGKAACCPSPSSPCAANPRAALALRSQNCHAPASQARP